MRLINFLTQITIKQKSVCNGNHSTLSAHQADSLRGKASIGRKGTLIGKAGNLGRRWTHVLRLPRFFSSLTLFKGKMGNNLSESSRQEVGVCIFLHCVQTGTLSSDVFLSRDLLKDCLGLGLLAVGVSLFSF